MAPAPTDPTSVILFGSGSPAVVDVEQTCARIGWSIAAVVKNVPGEVHSLVRQDAGDVRRPRGG